MNIINYDTLEVYSIKQCEIVQKPLEIDTIKYYIIVYHCHI